MSQGHAAVSWEGRAKNKRRDGEADHADWNAYVGLIAQTVLKDYGLKAFRVKAVE